jgi:hypothetical protein
VVDACCGFLRKWWKIFLAPGECQLVDFFGLDRRRLKRGERTSYKQVADLVSGWYWKHRVLC